MNLKKLKLLLPSTILSTSFMFNSVSAMQTRFGSKLEKIYLTNVLLYLPISERNKFAQVSKNTQESTHMLQIGAWEQLVDLGLKRQNCKERISIDNYDDFCNVKRRLMSCDGTPTNSGFDRCFFVETFDKNMDSYIIILVW